MLATVARSQPWFGGPVVFAKCNWPVEPLKWLAGTQVLLMGLPSSGVPDWLTNWLTCWLTEGLTDLLTDGLTEELAVWQTGWGPDWLTYWLTNLLTEGLTDCLVDWLCARKQSFPTCSPPRRISVGERCLVPSQCLQCGDQPWECSPASSPHSAWNASPTAAINQQQRLSLSLSRLSFFSLLYAHRHAGWGHFERVNRCRLICPGLSDIARVMYLMWSLFSSNKRIKN